MENKFQDSLLDKNILSVTWEVVPGRGARETAQESALAAAEAALWGGESDEYQPISRLRGDG